MISKEKSGKAAFAKAMFTFPLAISMLLVFSYNGQAYTNNSNNDTTITQASFKGGLEKLVEYMKVNTKYPENAKKEHAQGIVYVSFTVEENGKLSSFKVSKSSGNRDLDNEAVRIISTMPEWEPAIKNGKKITSTYTLPVKFMDLQVLSIEGKYKGKNLYLQNPFLNTNTNPPPFAVKKVLVNGIEQLLTINNSAVEIDLKNFKNGDKVKIEVFYESTAGSQNPKFLNPEVLQ